MPKSMTKILYIRGIKGLLKLNFNKMFKKDT